MDRNDVISQLKLIEHIGEGSYEKLFEDILTLEQNQYDLLIKYAELTEDKEFAKDLSKTKINFLTKEVYDKLIIQYLKDKESLYEETMLSLKNDYDKEISELQKKYDNLSDKYTKEKEEFDNETTLLKEQILASKDIVAEYNSNKDSFVNNLQKSVKEIEDKFVKEVLETKKNCQAEIRKIQNEYDEKINGLNNLLDTNKENNKKEMESLRTRYDNQMRSSREGYESKIANLTSEMAELKSMKELTSEDVYKYTSSINILEEENRSLKENLKEMEEERVDISEDVEKLQETLDSYKANKEKEIKELKDAHEAEVAEIKKEYEKEIFGLKKSIDVLRVRSRKDCKEKDEEIERLKSALKEIQNRINSFTVTNIE